MLPGFCGCRNNLEHLLPMERSRASEKPTATPRSNGLVRATAGSDPQPQHSHRFPFLSLSASPHSAPSYLLPKYHFFFSVRRKEYNTTRMLLLATRGNAWISSSHMPSVKACAGRTNCESQVLPRSLTRTIISGVRGRRAL